MSILKWFKHENSMQTNVYIVQVENCAIDLLSVTAISSYRNNGVLYIKVHLVGSVLPISIKPKEGETKQQYDVRSSTILAQLKFNFKSL